MKRLELILITLAVVLYRLVRGNAQARLTRPKTLVVINPTGNIGDMVCTTPVFRAVKKRSPETRVIVVGSPKNKVMMEGNTDIDEYISARLPFFQVVRLLRKEHVDAGIVINPSSKDFATLFFGNVRAISSFVLNEKYEDTQARSYKAVSNFGILVPYFPGENVPLQYVGLLKPFGLETEKAEKHIGFTKRSEALITEQFEKAGIHTSEHIIAIAPGSGTKVKQWPAERFGEIANYIHTKYGLGVAIIGGPDDTRETSTMKSVLTDGVRHVDFTGQSLDELKATLSKVALIIGNDSGTIYVAEAFGAGTLVLIGPTNEVEHPLQDSTHRVVVAKNRGEAQLLSHVSSEETIDMKVARNQIKAITVTQVCTELDDLLTYIIRTDTHGH